MSPDRVLITSGTSEGIELALTALVDEGDEVLVPSPTYPLYTAVLAKLGAARAYYRTDPTNGWLPDLDHLRALDHANDARTRGHRSRTTRPARSIPTTIRHELIEIAEQHGLVILADEVYGDLAYDGPVAPMAIARSRRADHLVFEPVEGVSGAGMASRMDGGGRRRASMPRWPRSRSSPMGGCAARARCSTRITAALPATDRIRRRSAPRCASAPS